jgi:hypothetical protein
MNTQLRDLAAVAFGLISILAVATTIGVLPFFFHHMSASLKVSFWVSAGAGALCAFSYLAALALFPSDLGVLASIVPFFLACSFGAMIVAQISAVWKGSAMDWIFRKMSKISDSGTGHGKNKES